MAFAIIIGILVGAASCIPFKCAIAKLRTVDPTKTASLAGLFAIAIAASFIVLAAGIVICRFVAYDVLIPYTVAEIIVFLIAVVIIGVRRQKHGK